MRTEIKESLQIPEGVECSYESGYLKCKSGDAEVSKKIVIPGVVIKVEDTSVIFQCKKGNKNHYKKIKSQIAHVKNLFSGVKEKFVYTLETASVHFPMTLKSESGKLIITNFLGEKNPRVAKILPEVEVEIKGNIITISSHDLELAGQTAANFEKAGKIKERDKRVFQDGIYIVDRPGGKTNA